MPCPSLGGGDETARFHQSYCWFVYRHDEPGLTRDEDGMRLAVTAPLPTPQEAFTKARKIVDNKVEGPRK
jgi:hypothetical protein